LHTVLESITIKLITCHRDVAMLLVIVSILVV